MSAVPKKVVVAALLKLQNPTEEEVSHFFTLLVAVVVTEEEEKMLNRQFIAEMPPEFFGADSSAALDVLLRYKKCGIEVLRVKWPGADHEYQNSLECVSL